MSEASDHIQDALDTVALLSAMYPLPEEFELAAESAEYIGDPSSTPPKQLDMTVRVGLDDHPDSILEVLITLPMTGGVKVMPKHPEWLSRGEHQILLDSIPTADEEPSASDYILTTIDSLRGECTTLLSAQLAGIVTEPAVPPTQVDDLQRVWFWFPTLSTREKRRDLVDYAPQYGLTGFVLAGKPALLCVEGDGRQVDRYMSEIKSRSWSDIPSYQKKVTERLRKPLSDPSQRKFTEMTEITHLVPTYGQYDHRIEMGEVKRLMDEWGVGEDFGVVVMNTNT